jgi:hypothetical protein
MVPISYPRHRFPPVVIQQGLSRQLSTSQEGAKANLVSCCCDGILPMRRRFGSEGPQRGPGDLRWGQRKNVIVCDARYTSFRKGLIILL